MNKFENLRKKIKGPVYPIPPAFNKDYSVNYNSVAKYVNFLINKGAKIIMVTVGTSRFNLLTDEEVNKLNKTVVSAAKGKAITIAANQIIGSTQKAIEFAKNAQNFGADTILIWYPERYYNDNGIFNYVKKIASSIKIGVLLHSVPIRNAGIKQPSTINLSLDLYKRLIKLDNFIGIKEENENENYRYELASCFKNEMSIIVAGGSMRKYLSCALFGVKSYLVGVGSFSPKIEEDFYKATEKKDYKKALKIVTEIEEPFFDIAMPMGWHVAMKGAMDLLGLMPGTERSPLPEASEEEKKQLKNVMNKIGIL